MNRERSTAQDAAHHSRSNVDRETRALLSFSLRELYRETFERRGEKKRRNTWTKIGRVAKCFFFLSLSFSLSFVSFFLSFESVPFSVFRDLEISNVNM